MTLEDYQKLALRTAPIPGQVAHALTDPAEIDLLHGAMGVCTEGGELMDAVKKLLIYGKSLDRVNVDEEIGDVLWYLALLARATGTSLEQIAAVNIAKLAKRYPERFSPEQAIQRDLPAERKILETAETMSNESAENQNTAGGIPIVSCGGRSLTSSHRASERKKNTFTLGRLFLTFTTQGAGAPLIDQAGCSERKPPFRTGRGWAILLTPWRRNQYGESLPQRALVVGWWGKTEKKP